MKLEAVRKSIPGRVVAKFGEDRALNWATIIAWSALLAMFPILLVMASLLGLVLGVVGIDTTDLYHRISQALPGADPNEIFKALDSFRNRSGILGIVGLLGLMFGGSALIGSMEQAFAVIYHTRPRHFVRQKLIAFGMIILFTVLGGIAVGTSTLLPLLKDIPGLPPSIATGPLAIILQVVLGTFTGFLLFASIYYVVPNRRQRWSQVWPGALLAGCLFEAITLVFPLYLEINRGIGNYGKTFALFFTLMTFFYFLGIVTMAGVEVNSVLYPVPVEQPASAVAPQPAPGGPGETGTYDEPSAVADGRRMMHGSQ
jgi:membrane protein